MWFLLIVVLISWVPCAVLSAPFPIIIVVMEDNVTSSLAFGYVRSMPAVNMAQEAVTLLYQDYINFTFIYKTTLCTGDGTGALAADLHCGHNIGVFIGPGCNKAIEALGALSKSWNIPLVTPVGSGLPNTQLYPLVTKMTPFSAASFIKAMVAILTKFLWTNIALIYDEDSSLSGVLRTGLVNIFGSTTFFDHKTYQLNSNGYTTDELRLLLEDASSSARVFLLLLNRNETRAFLLEAYNMGIAKSGEYVFFIFESLSTMPEGYYWKIGHPSDKRYLEALGHAIWPYVDIHLHANVNFTEEVVRRSLQDYGYDYKGNEPSAYISCYYDAVLMYATVLNETLAEGGNPLNGTAITKRMWNRTFPGINGPVRMNEEGFRQSDITFSSFDLKTGLLTTGAYYDYERNIIEENVDHSFPWPYSNGVPPPNEPACGFKNDRCEDSEEFPSVMVGVLTGVIALLGVIGFVVAVFMYRTWKRHHERDLWWWRIHSCDLSLNSYNECSYMHLKSSKHSLRKTGNRDDNSLSEKTMDGNLALWKGQVVCLRRLPLKQFTLTRAVLVEFKILRDLNHSNLIRIYGACLEESVKALITEYCMKGTLQDLLGNMNVSLDAQFKFSLCTDIINGLCYLHESPVRFHGRLSTNACLIDNRFSVKLSDFGLPTVYSNILVDDTSQEYKHDCMWKAPEILRSGSTAVGSMESDIYSYAIIMQEIITRDSPFAIESVYMTTDEIIQKIQEGGSPPFRPSTELPVTMADMKELIEICWTEDPRSRPTCQSVKRSVKRIAASLGDSGSLLDNLMRRMELYANNLEKMVEEKTAELREEKKKSEELLYQILPRSVADRLKSGLRVEPQAYEGVSIYFSDIVGFTQISAMSSPMEVVDLLNDLYSCFDAIIEEFDVYKVETIGDAYMVVSGLPQRNGNLHALNIAHMSIKALETIREFKIRHMPTESVKIRIGLHSGPVCAGVVGLKMPRYCLFGDTVNTASRMESSGKAMMIHISPSIKELLDQFGIFHIIPRGQITVKGKGEMFTYWLVTSQRNTDEVGDTSNA